MNTHHRFTNHFTSSRLLLLAALSAFLFVTSPVHAATMALTTTNVTSTTGAANNYKGLEFTVNQNITVTALGNYFISGNASTHTMKLSQVLTTVPGAVETGTETDLASVSLPIGTTVGASGYQFVDLTTPVALVAGQTYLVSALVPASDNLSPFGGNTFTLVPQISYVGAVDNADGTNYTSYTYIANSAYGTVNFLFEVPEPASMSGLLIGSLGLLRRRARQMAK